MKNEEVIRNFCTGVAEVQEANSVWMDKDRLFSYGTAIAQRYFDFIIVNDTRYSVTTSKAQGYLRKYMGDKKIIHVNDIPMWSRDLTKYVAN